MHDLMMSEGFDNNGTGAHLRVPLVAGCVVKGGISRDSGCSENGGLQGIGVSQLPVMVADEGLNNRLFEGVNKKFEALETDN